MSEKKVQMHEEDLDQVAGGNGLSDAMKWFKQKFDEILKKYQEQEQKKPPFDNIPTKPDFIAPLHNPIGRD